MGLELPYTVLDVFAESPLEGNALAVFHDGTALSAAQMQALARETNLSETTFVLPANEPGEDRALGVRVRIFTPQEELPFAGHPTLGTAAWLRLHHPERCQGERVDLRLSAGRIPVIFDPATPGACGLHGTMRQNDPVFGDEHSPEEVASVLGLQTTDMLSGYPPQVVSTGNAFCVVPLRDTSALAQLEIPQREAKLWLRARGARWFFCIAPEPQSASVWRARMQWESGEDPATGSAAGPCGAWLVRVGLAASGSAITLRQGLEIQRPSRMEVRADQDADGRVTNVRVGGRTIPVAAGRFVLGN